MTAKIVHLIQLLSTGGAFRADLSAIKYLHNLRPFAHYFVSLAPHLDDPAAKELARSHGVQILSWNSKEEFLKILSDADLVHLDYWNCPEIDLLFQDALPPMRLLGWFHIGGHTPPQYLPEEMLSNFDSLIACSPQTYESPGFIKARSNHQTTGMAYGAADFERLSGYEKKPHDGFNVGYIGTVNFLKMHRRYIPMSASVNIPNVKFIVCGSGGAEDILRKEARELNALHKFDIKGYVSDINPILSVLDAYGYPLCEDTYAASEINLQEVMYCGIPPVVFPYGGTPKLVTHHETGLIAFNEQEYAQHLEYLYLNPKERERIGTNAKQYAAEVFGAQNAAKLLGTYYDALLTKPKTKREAKTQNISGHQIFLKYLADLSTPFMTSINGKDERNILLAEENIKGMSDLMKQGGILPFQRGFPTDPYLNLWAGLSEESANPQKAVVHYVDAFNNGATHWRVLWYIAKTAHQIGEHKLCKDALAAVCAQAPTFKPAQELSKTISL